MIDPVTLSLIGIGVSGALGAGNMALTNKTNKKSREHNLQMFDLQNKKQLEFWNLQNAYNHPLEQRKRLEAAGLNPALMYKGGLDNSAGSLTSTAPQKWDPTPPQFDVSGLNTLGNTLIANQRLQIDKDIAKSQIALNEANALSVLAGIPKKTSDSNYSDPLNIARLKLLARQEQNILADTNLKWVKNLSEQAQTAYLEAKTELAITDNEIKKYMKEVNFNKAVMDMILKLTQKKYLEAGITNFDTIKANVNSMINSRNWDAYYKEFQLAMEKNGITKNDPLWWKVLGISFLNSQEMLGLKPFNFKPMPFVPDNK